MPNIPKVYDSERIDLTDFNAFMAIPMAHNQQLLGGLLTDPQATVKARIASGFKPTDNDDPNLKQLRVDRGVGVLSMKDKGVVSHGTLTTEGDAEKILDLTAYANGTYGIWIRFEFVDGEVTNRIFWDPAAPAEYSQSVATRRVAGWGITLVAYIPPAEAASPGPEWAYIGDVLVATSTITVTPKRDLYFEGDESDTYALTWGSGNDRNADRDAYGLRDMQTAFQAVLKKIEEMQSGSSRWWTATAEPLDRKIGRDGDLTPSGNYKFNDASKYFEVDGVIRADGGIQHTAVSNPDIGSTGSRFDELYLSKLINISAISGEASIVVEAPSQAARLTLRNSGTPTEKLELLYNIFGTNLAIVSTDGLLYFAPFGTDTSNAPMVFASATSIVPAVNDSVSLGLGGGSPLRWKDVQTVDLAVTEFLTLTGAEVVGNIIPSTGGSQNLGSSADVWNAFIGTLDVTTITKTGTITVNPSVETVFTTAVEMQGAVHVSGGTGLDVDVVADFAGEVTFREAVVGTVTSKGLNVRNDNSSRVPITLDNSTGGFNAAAFIRFEGVPNAGTGLELTGAPPPNNSYAKIKIKIQGTEKFLHVYDS